MPVTGLYLVPGGAAGRDSNQHDPATPAWAPEWLPSKKSMDYTITLASVAFLVLGSFYFLGIRVKPVRVAMAARQELL